MPPPPCLCSYYAVIFCLLITFSISLMLFSLIFGRLFIIPAVLTEVVTCEETRDESGNWWAMG
jgi:uncharacterized membrane protein HdeD (DUF308 family)